MISSENTEPPYDKFEDVYGILPVQGWLTRAEARLLWDEARKTEGAILEVGCYQGRSTVLLASLKRPVHSVDPIEGFTTDYRPEEIEARFRQNILDRQLEAYVLFHRMRIENWPVRSVGFAYLDGDHTRLGTVNQISVACRCMPKVIAIHDIAEGGDGLAIKEVALDMLGPWDARVERLAVWRRL